MKTKSDKIQVMIVDDEPLGRAMVRGMLETHEEVEIICECKNGEEAILALESTSPDLMFLDVQMPEIDGFSVLEAVKNENIPTVIFVTAFDEYAIRAFETGALDYLLKPFDRKRFEQAFGRAMRQIENQKRNFDSNLILSLLSQTQARENFLDRFIIKDRGRIQFVNAKEIAFIEAEGNYVLLHSAEKKFILREAISKLEDRLDPKHFTRISRSTIVNLDFVSELQVEFRGNYGVILTNGARLKLSSKYRSNLNRFSAGGI